MVTKRFFEVPIAFQNSEPDRPLRPAVQKASGPGLYSELTRCYTYMEWAESYVRDVEMRIVDKDMHHAEDRKRTADTIAALRETHQEQLNSPCEQWVEAAPENSNQALIFLKKREEAVKASEAKMKRVEAKSKTYQHLCHNILKLGDKVDNALRDVKNLTARKKTHQSAFEKWEKQYCMPVIDLVVYTQ